MTSQYENSIGGGIGCPALLYTLPTRIRPQARQSIDIPHNPADMRCPRGCGVRRLWLESAMDELSRRADDRPRRVRLRCYSERGKQTAGHTAERPWRMLPPRGRAFRLGRSATRADGTMRGPAAIWSAWEWRSAFWGTPSRCTITVSIAPRQRPCGGSPSATRTSAPALTDHWRGLRPTCGPADRTESESRSR